MRRELDASYRPQGMRRALCTRVVTGGRVEGSCLAPAIYARHPVYGCAGRVEMTWIGWAMHRRRRAPKMTAREQSQLAKT